MRNVVIAAAVLSLALGGTSNVLAYDKDAGVDATARPAIASTQEGESGTANNCPLERGLSVLVGRPFKLGWGAGVRAAVLFS